MPIPRSPVLRVEEDLHIPRDRTRVPEHQAELPDNVFEKDSNETARSEDPPRLLPPYNLSNISSTSSSRSRKRKAEDDILVSDDSAVIVYNSSDVCPDIAVSQPFLPTLHILIMTSGQAQSTSHQASAKGTPTPPSNPHSKPHLLLRPRLGRSIPSPV